MKKALFLLFAVLTLQLTAQNDTLTKDVLSSKHFISINPLNLILFQQAGLSYEFKPGKMGIGLTAGYIYANHKEYSNYFIAGPTNIGSLGDYSGCFIIPQINYYFVQQKPDKKLPFLYAYIKPVYRNMKLDSSYKTQWIHHGDGNFTYRKMDDEVEVYGGFVGVGIKYVFSRFFVDSNLGIGKLVVTHDMTIYEASQPYAGYYEEFDPPLEESLYESNFTVNFSVNIGINF